MHRDLKLDNLLFDEDNNIKIIDFGLATKCDVPKLKYYRCGTPGYVAPEVINLKENDIVYGPECDIYSLGIIFYMLVFKKGVFNGKNNNETVELNKKGEHDLA